MSKHWGGFRFLSSHDSLVFFSFRNEICYRLFNIEQYVGVERQNWTLMNENYCQFNRDWSFVLLLKVICVICSAFRSCQIQNETIPKYRVRNKTLRLLLGAIMVYFKHIMSCLNKTNCRRWKILNKNNLNN
jgi:hypothetical protein